MTSKARSIVVRFRDGEQGVIPKISARERERLFAAWESGEKRYLGLDRDGPIALDLTEVSMMALMAPQAEKMMEDRLAEMAKQEEDDAPKPALSMAEIVSMMAAGGNA